MYTVSQICLNNTNNEIRQQNLFRFVEKSEISGPAIVYLKFL